MDPSCWACGIMACTLIITQHASCLPACTPTPNKFCKLCSCQSWGTSREGGPGMFQSHQMTVFRCSQTMSWDCHCCPGQELWHAGAGLLDLKAVCPAVSNTTPSGAASLQPGKTTGTDTYLAQMIVMETIEPRQRTDSREAGWMQSLHHKPYLRLEHVQSRIQNSLMLVLFRLLSSSIRDAFQFKELPCHQDSTMIIKLHSWMLETLGTSCIPI